METINKIKHAVIVYNPGYAGNFLQRVFSLGKEVVPQIPLHLLEDNYNLRYYDNRRLELYSFKQVRNNYLNWQKFHRAWPTFYDYDKIKSKIESTDGYTHIVFSMHYPEYENLINDLNQTQEVKYFYVDLDLTKYQSWINKAQQDLNYKYRVGELESYEILKQDSKFNKIDLTRMLESEDSFEQEYISICNLLGIDSNIESAILLYRDWFETRVKYYLN